MGVRLFLPCAIQLVDYFTVFTLVSTVSLAFKICRKKVETIESCAFLSTLYNNDMNVPVVEVHFLTLILKLQIQGQHVYLSRSVKLEFYLNKTTKESIFRRT